LIQGPATRVMSLRDGTKKMSKSDPSDYSRINLTDTADIIAQKVRKAKTDPEPLPSEAAGPFGTAGGGKSRRHLRRARKRQS
jgi:tryptophanyl-tRNA synthetase